MNWLSTTALLVGILIWYSKKAAPKRTARAAPSEKTKSMTDQKIEEVLSSNDLEKMAAALGATVDPLHRHRLLSALVAGLYPKRKDVAVRNRLYAYGKIYLNEFDQMAPAVKADTASEKMDVPVFKCLTIAMEEDQRYREALDICRLALNWGIDDGTKTGYEGRTIRLRKKQAAA